MPPAILAVAIAIVVPMINIRQPKTKSVHATVLSPLGNTKNTHRTAIAQIKIFKGIPVIVVYNFANAVKFDEISYADVLTKDLKVMDQTAITLCKDNDIDLCVFNMQEDGNIAKACDGQKIGTTISGGK